MKKSIIGDKIMSKISKTSLKKQSYEKKTNSETLYSMRKMFVTMPHHVFRTIYVTFASDINATFFQQYM